MTAYQIPPQPACTMKCTGDVCTKLKYFKHAWEYYCKATELTEKPELVKVGLLYSVMSLEC